MNMIILNSHFPSKKSNIHEVEVKMRNADNVVKINEGAFKHDEKTGITYF